MRVIATYSCTQATSELQLATRQAMNADGRAPLELYMHAQNTTKYDQMYTSQYEVGNGLLGQSEAKQLCTYKEQVVQVTI